MGFLVSAILHGNNLRDIAHDTAAKIMTLANVTGHHAGKITYFGLLTAAYLAVAAMILARTLSPLSLIVFLSLPLAARNLKTVYRSEPDNPLSIAIIDVQTAKLHLAFGILLGLSIMLPALLR